MSAKSISRPRWTPSSWRGLPAKHIPDDYPDPQALRDVETSLKNSPPLVYPGEAIRLKDKLADVAMGKAFLLQGGDCAESFKEFHPDNIQATFRVMMQMAVVLTYGAGQPVVKVGRIAGQFGKPRSSPVTCRNRIERFGVYPSCIAIWNASAISNSATVPDPSSSAPL